MRYIIWFKKHPCYTFATVFICLLQLKHRINLWVIYSIVQPQFSRLKKKKSRTRLPCLIFNKLSWASFVSSSVLMTCTFLTKLRFAYKIVRWLIDWLIDRLIYWLVGWLIDWLIDWISGCLLAWFIDWFLHSFIPSYIHLFIHSFIIYSCIHSLTAWMRIRHWLRLYIPDIIIGCFFVWDQSAKSIFFIIITDYY